MPLMLVSFFVTACSPIMNDSATCDGLSRFIDAHNAALLEDGGNGSVVTGAAIYRHMTKPAEPDDPCDDVTHWFA